MADGDEIEEIIKMIAAKHSVAIGRDDPIMILSTVNEYLMRKSAEAQQQIVDEFRENMESAAHQWTHDATAKAEKILNAALDATKMSMTRQMEGAARKVAEAVQAALDAPKLDIERTLTEGKRVAWVNVGCAALTLMAACVSLVVHVWL